MINEYWSEHAASQIIHETQLVSQSMQMAAAAQEEAAIESKRPFMMLNPKMYPDGNQWCCLLGEDLQVGIAGFGDSPDEASRDFDKEWIKPIPGRTTAQ
jgi:hypothetical protein